jgi:SAM-dependent methyltransferase
MSVPLRLGSPDDFSRTQSLLTAAGYDEATLCRTLGIATLADLDRARSEDLGGPAADSSPLWLLIKLFLFGQSIAPAEVDEILAPEARAALVALDLVRLGPLGSDGAVYYSPVLLYPVVGVLIASDRYDNPDLSPLVPPPDIVFPAIFSGTLRFLRVIAKSPARAVLDLCSGTGIGALMLSKQAQRVVAADITDRATHFTRFNGLLNGCGNLEVVQGDLYEPVHGRTFDRIIAHPPYVPAVTAALIYRDAEEVGESILRRIVAGLPQHLLPGGTFYCVTGGWDSREGPFEQRVRRWLGDHAGEYDVIFAQHDTQSRGAVARWLDKKVRAGPGSNGPAWEQRLMEAGLERHVYGALAIHRVAAGAVRSRAPVTTRPRLGERSDGACFEWALRWHEWRAAREAAGNLSEALLDATHRLAPALRVNMTYVPREGQLALASVMLEAERPFKAGTGVEAWMLELVSRFGVGRSARAVYESARAEGSLPTGFGPDDFATLLALLVERGYLESDLPAS